MSPKIAHNKINSFGYEQRTPIAVILKGRNLCPFKSQYLHSLLSYPKRQHNIFSFQHKICFFLSFHFPNNLFSFIFNLVFFFFFFGCPKSLSRFRSTFVKKKKTMLSFVFLKVFLIVL